MGAIHIGIACFIGYIAGANYINGEKSEQWSDAAGKIVDTSIKISSGRHNTYYDPVIKYTYAVLGKQYVNDNIGFGFSSNNFNRQQDARIYLDGYQKGAKVTVYYDPQNPKNSCLKRGMGFNPSAYLLGTGVAVLLFLFYGVWFITGIGMNRNSMQRL